MAAGRTPLACIVALLIVFSLVLGWVLLRNVRERDKNASTPVLNLFAPSETVSIDSTLSSIEIGDRDAAQSKVKKFSLPMEGALTRRSNTTRAVSKARKDVQRMLHLSDLEKRSAERASTESTRQLTAVHALRSAPTVVPAPDVRWYGPLTEPLSKSSIPNDSVIEAASGGPAAKTVGDGSNAPIGEDEISLTPHLDMGDGKPLAPGRIYTLRVFADANPAREGEDSTDIQIPLVGAPDDPVQVVAYVMTSQQLRLPIGSTSRRNMMIQRGRPAEEVTFRIQVEHERYQDGSPGIITVLFFYQGYPCGRIRRSFQIDSPLQADVETRPFAGDSSSAPPEESSVFKLPAGGPDMTISVVETDRLGKAGRPRYQCFIQARDAEPSCTETEYWSVEDFKKEIEQRFSSFAWDVDPDQARSGLKAAGRAFFDLSPPVFQQVFWQLARKGKLPLTILIFSDEPHLPWELMVPWEETRKSRRSRSKIRDEGALGVKSAIGRWTAAPHRTLRVPPRTILLRRSAVWAPQYEERKLLTSLEERDFVAANMNGSPPVHPANFRQLLAALKPNDVTLLHLVCHGESDRYQDATQTIEGEAETGFSETRISVEQLAGSDEFTEFCSRGPLIFFNACAVGQTIKTMTGVGGFAPTFIQLDAGAVVAPLWAVRDDVATPFAQKFYNRVRQQPSIPFAEILQAIRKEAFEGPTMPGIATYAAYCFYGDPLAIPSFEAYSTPAEVEIPDEQ